MRDGDTGLPRDIDLSLLGDNLEFFVLDYERGSKDEEGVITATLRTSENNIDREMEV